MDGQMVHEKSNDAFTVMIVATLGSAAAVAAEAAVRIADGHAPLPLDWRAVAEGAMPGCDPALILAEAAGASDDDVEAGLARVALLARSDHVRVIVAFDETQIDLVAAGSVPGAELLCAPSVAERVAAIGVLGRLPDRPLVADRVAESEATRLARLNEEVARIAEVLSRLSRRDHATVPEPLRGQVGDRRTGFAVEPVAKVEVTPGEVRAAIRSRRLRDRTFGAGWFEDPAWDMLLDLFAAHLERAQVSVSSLCIAAAVAPTTALRWIGKLTDAGLLEREADPFDRRRAFMRLTARAREGMLCYCAEVRAQGLAIA